MKYFLISLALAMFSCSYPVADKLSPEVNQIHAGEKFRINLPEDHSTGYTWVLSNDYDHKIVSYEKAVWHGKEKGVDFNCEALGAGITTLTFYSIMYRDTGDSRVLIINVK